MQRFSGLIFVGSVVFVWLIDALRRYFPIAYSVPPRPLGGLEVEDYVGIFTGPVNALLYAGLFCPPLEEMGGVVLHRYRYRGPDDEEAIRRYREGAGGDLRETQRHFNYREVLDIVGRTGPEVGGDEGRLLAELLADAWRGCLCVRYPGRRFVVEVVEEEYEGEGLGLTFYEST